MGFIDDLVGSIGNAVTGGVSGLVTGIFSKRPNVDYNTPYQYSVKAAEHTQMLGQKTADQNLDRLLGLGLTPQEIAGGGSGAVSGQSGQVMGNGPAQAQLQAAQMQIEERSKDRATDLMKTAIAAQTSVKTAEISAGPGSRQASIAEAKLAGELLVLKNQGITSGPEFIRTMKEMGQAPANSAAWTISNDFQAKWKVRISTATPEQWAKIPVKARQKLLRDLVGAGSGLFSTIGGLGLLGDEAVENIPDVEPGGTPATPKPKRRRPSKSYPDTSGFSRYMKGRAESRTRKYHRVPGRGVR